MSFIADRVKMDGLTFDDVLLIPAYSEVLPREVSLAEGVLAGIGFVLGLGDVLVCYQTHEFAVGVDNVKTKYPELDVVVGNIATGDAARYLVECGADGVNEPMPRYVLYLRPL